MKLDAAQPLMKIKPPFPTKNFCWLLRLDGDEYISELYHYRLEIITDNDALKPNEVLGKCINFDLHDQHHPNRPIARSFHGLITEFEIGAPIIYTFKQQKFNCKRYFLKVAPQLWLLQKTRQSRIFQKKEQTVLDIVEKILKPYPIAYEANYVKNPLRWEYCSQYNETDYDFLQRILAEAGIYYFFNQTSEQDTLILANSCTAYFSPALELRSKLDKRQWPHIKKFKQKYSLVSHNFAFSNAVIEHGNNALYATKALQSSYTDNPAIKKTSQLNFSNLMRTNSDGETLAKLATEQHTQETYLCEGESNDCNLQVGATIKLNGHYFSELEPNEHVVTALNFTVLNQYFLDSSLNNENAYGYSNSWFSLPKTLCYRPQRRLKPNPGQLQLATIVNSQGETNAQQVVHCDKYGRQCVKFIWEFGAAQKSSERKYDLCWARVLNTWDNGNYRVGTPVIISFVNGDIDKPLILGMVNDQLNLLQGLYNSNNDCTSILKRYPGVEAGDDYNSISFNDKKNQEKLGVFAGKDFEIIVKKGNQHTIVNEGNALYEIKKGQQTATIAGEESHTNQADYKHTVKKNYVLKVDGKLTIEASAGVDIKSDGALKFEGASINIEASQSVSVKGGTSVSVKGATVKIN